MTNSSSSRTFGCRNGSPRRRDISRTKASTTSFRSSSSRPTARTITRATRSAPCSRSSAAAAKGKGRLYAGVYSVAPSGVFVPQDSPVRKPEDLDGVPIAVGNQSGSHYSTIQALEQYMPADKINLTYADGMLFHRLDQLIEGKAQASALFSGPYYFAEQLGFRKVIDTTFMIATMVSGNPDPEDLRKFFRALRRAQRDIDLRPELYTHYYTNEFPDRFHAQMDTRRWGPGERLVFEPYTKEVYEQSFEWIAAHGMFADTGMGTGDYEKATLSLNA